MIPNKKIASAVGAKTARACDYCIRKRARWYCAADDAFLCQACDSSVHSANPLASRHERVRLKTSSLKLPHKPSADSSAPSWHRGFTRKARTPRHGKQTSNKHQAAEAAKFDDTTQYPHPLVPELGADDSTSFDENEEQLLYRVPIYDPFVAEFRISTPPSNEATPTTNIATPDAAKFDHTRAEVSPHDEFRDGKDDISCFLPSEMDLAEFAADVETLLGKGLDQETYTIEELGLLDDDCREGHNAIFDQDSMSSRSGSVKAEENNMEAIMTATCNTETETDVIRGPFELSFDYDTPTTCEEEDVKAAIGAKEQDLGTASLHKDDEDKKGKMMISLRLDYEAIRAAWGGQGSPWMNGERPEINPDDGWPHGTQGACGTEVHQPYGGGMGIVGNGEHTTTARGDGGREARVSRYREKRRTRLFSKKIRYEVRKLNAEKRPRMKGRFVKRSSFEPPNGSFPILGK